MKIDHRSWHDRIDSSEIPPSTHSTYLVISLYWQTSPWRAASVLTECMNRLDLTYPPNLSDYQCFLKLLPFKPPRHYVLLQTSAPIDPLQVDEIRKWCFCWRAIKCISVNRTYPQGESIVAIADCVERLISIFLDIMGLVEDDLSGFNSKASVEWRSVTDWLCSMSVYRSSRRLGRSFVAHVNVDAFL